MLKVTRCDEQYIVTVVTFFRFYHLGHLGLGCCYKCWGKFDAEADFVASTLFAGLQLTIGGGAGTLRKFKREKLPLSQVM